MPSQPSDPLATYENPLVTRYAGAEMAQLWGPRRRVGTWRRLWLALAEAQSELGLLADDGVTPRIRPEQLAELRAHLDDIDFERAAKHERRLRHDVMAHVITYGDACPLARDIIHLGATSCFVTDNTDLILIRDGLRLLRDRLVGVIDRLARFAEQWRDLPTLGFTHFQPAQPTTVGKRACLWCYDFVLDLREVERRLETLPFRGVKGTTGTQASFLTLFRGDHAKVRRLDQLVAHKMGFEQVAPVTGQTYSRKIDAQVLDTLAGIAQSAHKFGTDLRLLAHRQELEEPFEAEQVGSSAMAYKRNPMRAERMCGLARFVMSLASNAAQTAAVQWLERTLDDSVNRRLTLPQAFLATDGVLRLALNIVAGLVVNPAVIARHLNEALPFLATESILMAAVARGGDRQELHERLRQHSLAVSERLKAGGTVNDLIDRLRADPAFVGVDVAAALAPQHLVGRAPQQVDEFLAEEVTPIRRRYPHLLSQSAEISV
ncbi:MAG: adenylosuccinate lyase [Gemmataceae bacterium]|nr:adenylosuccinate lyase [Gemmataceae bacterium]MDW8265930.1 adenylosuccinate lyase [Gemmataceae bacterium]